jgi:YVTN family beta-propeller protein
VFFSGRSFRAFHTVVAVVSLLLAAGCTDQFRVVITPVFTATADPVQSQRSIEVNFNGGNQGTAVVVDLQADAVLGIFNVGTGPSSVAVNSNASLMYVANQNGDSVSAISTSLPGGEVTSTITLPAGSHPSFITAPNLVNVYVANPGNGTVSVISQALQALSKTVPVGANPVWIQASNDSSKIYVLNQGSGTVSVISTADFSTIATLPVGASPTTAAISPGGLLFVANQGSNSISVIDTSTDTVGPPLAVGSAPSALTFDPTLNRLYVVNSGSNSLSVFKADVNPPVLLKTIPVGTSPVGVVALSDGSRVYVVNSGSNNVSVVDTGSLTVTKTITVGANPTQITVGTDGRRILVLNSGSNDMTFIQTSNDTVVLTTPLPQGSNTPKAVSSFSFT